MQISPPSSTSCLSICFPYHRRTAAPPTAQGRLQGHLLLLSFPTRRARALTAAFASRRALSSPCHTAPSARRPPPRCRHGPAKTEPQSPISCTHRHYKNALDPFPSSFRHFPDPDRGTPPSLRPNPGKLDAAVKPLLQPSSARADPSISFASTSRNSPTPPPCPEPVGATSPSSSLHRRPACSRRAATIGHPDLDPGHLQVRTDLVNLPRPSTLAAGDRRLRIWPVNPTPLL